MTQFESLEGRTLFATYAVSNATQLIAAMRSADRAAGADTISVSAGAIMTLTAADNMVSGATGLPPVTDAAGVTIVGNGAFIERDAGAPAFRFFDVAAGGSLTLTNLTMRNGAAAGGHSQDGAFVTYAARGGAVLNAGSLTLNGVTFRDNGAFGNNGTYGWGGPLIPASDGAGGAVYSSGALAADGCAFEQNRASGGSGASETPRSMPGNSTPTNPATPSANGYGGGLYVGGGSAAVARSVFTGNVASGGPRANGAGAAAGSAYGGGVYSGGTVTLRNCTVTLNSAYGWGYSTRKGSTDGVGIGGGIYRGGGSLGLDDFTVAHAVDNAATTSSPNIGGSYKRLR